MKPKENRASGERTTVSPGCGNTEVVDVRVISASSRDLDAEISAGRLREDQYYRLGVALAIPLWYSAARIFRSLPNILLHW